MTAANISKSGKCEVSSGGNRDHRRYGEMIRSPALLFIASPRILGGWVRTQAESERGGQCAHHNRNVRVPSTTRVRMIGLGSGLHPEVVHARNRGGAIRVVLTFPLPEHSPGST